MNAAWILCLSYLAPGEGVSLDTAPTPVRVLWGDADADGARDALVLDAPGGARLLLGGPDGYRDATETSGLPAGLAARAALWEDLDADGHADVVLVAVGGVPRLFRGAGDGTFHEAEGALPPATGVTAFAVADVDGDGWQDVLGARDGGGPVAYLNVGGTGFELAELGPAPPRPAAAPATRGGPPPETCSDYVEDLASNACIAASWVPTLGMLYPLGYEFFVDGAGNVGVGTVGPQAALDVRGGDDLRVEDGSIGFYDGTRRGVSLEPSILRITNDADVETVLVDAADDGGELHLRNDLGAETVFMGSEPNVGTVSLRDSGGTERFLAYGGNGEGGVLSLRSSTGAETVDLDADSSNNGTLTLRNGSGQTRAFVGGSATDGGGYMSLYSGTGSFGVVVDAQYTQGESAMFLYNDVGTNTLLLDSDSNGGGYVSIRDDTVGIHNEIQLQARNSAGNAQIGMTGSTGVMTVAMVNTDGGAGSLTLWETDGSLAFRMRGSFFTLHNASGSTTQTYSRITGSKSAVVPTESGGSRLMYAIESPELWFQDSGRARLVDGETRVELDPVFLETVTVDDEHPLKVSVTPTSPSSLFVAEKGAGHFVVRAAGRAPAGATFDWRVSAKRRGTEALRLEPVTPEPTETEPVPVEEGR